jgi:trimeric autotransporter adhesin
MRLFTCIVILTLQLSLNAQNMGIKLPVSTLPNTTLDVNGSTAFREGTAISLTNPVNNDVALADFSFYRIIGATAAFSITGFGNGQNGRVLFLINATAFNMTLSNLNALSALENRINTGSSDNLTLAPSGSVTLIYNATVQKWAVFSKSGELNNWNLKGNTGTTPGTHFIGTTDPQSLVFKSNGSEGMRLNTSGNIGIGTPSPNARLNIMGGDIMLGTATPTMTIYPDSSRKMIIRGDNGNNTDDVNLYNYYVSNDVTHFRINLGDDDVNTHDDLFQVGNLAYTDNVWHPWFTASSSGLGIGTPSPNQQLEITAAFRMPTTTSSTTGVIYKGVNRFIHNYKPSSNDGNNTFIGINAGNFTMSSATSWLASGNTAIGANTLTSLTEGGYNTAVGVNALAANTTGNYNMAFGSQALSSNISGVGNVAVGHSSLEKNTASSNTAIGNAAMSLNTTGTGLVAIGESSMQKNTIGNYNTSVGQSAMRDNIDGSNNTALGLSALQLNTSGSYNVAVGTSSLTDNLTGSNNTAIGYDALSATKSSNNVALGYSAGTGTTTGGNNVFVGYSTGITNTTGSNNTLLGYEANVLSSGLTNATAIGYSAIASSSNSLILGGTGANAVRVGIGTSNPAAKLEIKTGPSNNGIMLTSSTTSVFGSLISVDPNINVAANTPINSLWFTQSENADIAMGTNNITRFWIKANGNVGIGVNDPSHILHINSQGRSSNAAWATTSDIRLKNIDKPFEYGLKELMEINTYRFHYKENNALKLPSDKGYQGVMAQELQKVIPEAVTKQADGYFTVNTDPVFWTMLNSVKEINTANKKLKAESDALKLELEQVKAELKKQQALTEKALNNTDKLKEENTILKASVEKNSQDIEALKAMLEKKQN